MEHSALNHYLGKDGLKKRNCAQAILCAYQEVLNISEEKIEEFQSFGGGKAPENCCGAVYAAEYLLNVSGHKSAVEDLKETFQNIVGTVKCKEIRESKKLSCLGCVQNSARFLQDIILERPDRLEEEKAI